MMMIEWKFIDGLMRDKSFSKFASNPFIELVSWFVICVSVRVRACFMYVCLTCVYAFTTLRLIAKRNYI